MVAEETSDSHQHRAPPAWYAQCRTLSGGPRVCRRNKLNIAPWVWVVSIVVLVAILPADLLIIGRRPHEPSIRESSLWVTFYVALAIIFGIGVWATAGNTPAVEFYTG